LNNSPPKALSNNSNILILAIGYILIHLALRVYFSQTLQVDDAEKIESAQHHPLAKFEKNKLLKQDV
jgi:hypothetical protein